MNFAKFYQYALFAVLLVSLFACRYDLDALIGGKDPVYLDPQTAWVSSDACSTKSVESRTAVDDGNCEAPDSPSIVSKMEVIDDVLTVELVQTDQGRNVSLAEMLYKDDDADSAGSRSLTCTLMPAEMIPKRTVYHCTLKHKEGDFSDVTYKLHSFRLAVEGCTAHTEFEARFPYGSDCTTWFYPQNVMINGDIVPELVDRKETP